METGWFIVYIWKIGRSIADDGRKSSCDRIGMFAGFSTNGMKFLSLIITITAAGKDSPGTFHPSSRVVRLHRDDPDRLVRPAFDG